MPLTVRKFNAQVKDPTSGDMIPAGLLSSDSLEAIEAAETAAVAAVGAKQAVSEAAIELKGATTLASIPADYTTLDNEVDDLKTQLNAFESEMSESSTIPSSDWSKGTIDDDGNPSGNGARCRTNNYITFSPTDKIYIAQNNTKFKIFYYLDESTFIDGSDWITESLYVPHIQNGNYIKLVGAYTNDSTLSDDDVATIASEVTAYSILSSNEINAKFNDVNGDISEIDNRENTLDNRFYLDAIITPTWESGTIDEHGAPSGNGTRCRFADYLEVNEKTTVAITPNNTKFVIAYYDANHTHISSTSWISSNTTITSFGSAKYIKMAGAFSNNATVNNSDIPGIADDVTITQKQLYTMQSVANKLKWIDDNITNKPLTIMSFNVQNFTGLNAIEAMHEIIEDKYDPDIIGVQEFVETINGTSIYTDVYKPYQYHFRYSGIPTPNGIMSKKRLFDAMGVEFTHQSIDDPDAVLTKELRAYSKAYIYHEGKKICWINTHLDLNTSTSFLQLAEIKDVMDAEKYSILTGDFNINITAIDSTNYINAIKPFVDDGYNVSNNSEKYGINWTFSNSVTGTSALQSIDTIIVSGNIEIRDFCVDKTKLEFLNGTNVVDHIPVIIRVLLN